jgi:hypothetical protein
MNLKKIMKCAFSVLIFALLLCNVAAGQPSSSREKPNWINEPARELNNSVIQVLKATGTTEDEARNKAVAEIGKWQSSSGGQRLQVQIKDGNAVIVGYDDLTVKARIKDEYCEKERFGQYRVYLLVQIAKNPDPSYKLERVDVTDKYDFSPRVFVPGMAQIYKGSKGKGVFFIAAEASLIVGAVIMENLRANENSLQKTTLDRATQEFYRDNAIMYKNIRTGMVAGAIVIYAWNIIDGWVAPGKKHIVVGSTKLQIAPYATPQSGGMALVLNF